MAIVSLSHSNLQQCYSQQPLKHSHVNSYILHEQDEDAEKNSNTVGDLSDRYLEERSVFVCKQKKKKKKKKKNQGEKGIIMKNPF